MLDILYENIGGKIKNWAKRLFVIEAIGAIIAGIALLIDNGFEDGWWALFIIIFGPVVAFVSSWLLYAFGQLVEDVHTMQMQNAGNLNVEKNENKHESPLGTPKKRQTDSENSQAENVIAPPPMDVMEFRCLVKEMRTADLETLIKKQKHLYSTEQIRIIAQELKYRYE